MTALVSSTATLLVMVPNMAPSTIWSCDLPAFTQPPLRVSEKSVDSDSVRRVNLAVNQKVGRHSGDKVMSC